MAYSYIQLYSSSWFEPSHCLVNLVCPWSLTLRILILNFCDTCSLQHTHMHTLMHTHTHAHTHAHTHTHTHTRTPHTLDLLHSALVKSVLTLINWGSTHVYLFQFVQFWFWDTLIQTFMRKLPITKPVQGHDIFAFLSSTLSSPAKQGTFPYWLGVQ